MEWIEPGFLGLFIATFLAATVLPFSSEVILVATLSAGFNPTYCLLIATAGNTLGGMSSFALGWLGDWHKMNKWLRVKEADLNKWKSMIDRYGYWAALLCWLPFIGDPIAIALGFFRVNWRAVAILMLIGKFARYAILIFVLQNMR